MIDPDRATQILTMNSGSSSLKFALFHMGLSETLMFSGQMARIGLRGGRFQVKRANGNVLCDQAVELADHDRALQVLLAWSREQPETPGSIHEGGELGYSLSHSFGAVFDNPDLIVACVVGDGVAFQQVSQSGHRRRGVADPASQRFQDRQSDHPVADRA